VIRATTVASIEPVKVTLARALRRAAKRRWPTRMPRPVHVAAKAADDEPSSDSLRTLIEALAGHAPVLVIIDEFGKNLEHHTTADQHELFVLQEVAEMFSGETPTAHGGIVTLQHLAFDDYASTLSVAARREWAKVQGRFEDVSFVDTPDQIVRLIGDSIEHRPATRAMASRLREWSDAAGARVASLGLVDLFGGQAGLVGRCYPLHPVAAAALPALCSQYGQYERTLMSFLASGEPDSVLAFCSSARDSAPLPLVGLSEVYDYFVTAARTLTGAAAGAARWLEIESRVSDAHVDDDDLELLKVVGVLNLVSDGPVRATADMVEFAADFAGTRVEDVTPASSSPCRARNHHPSPVR